MRGLAFRSISAAFLLIASAGSVFAQVKTKSSSNDEAIRLSVEALFKGIPLTPAQRGAADSITRAALDSMIHLPGSPDRAAKVQRLRDMRDVDLRDLLTSQQAKIRFDSNAVRLTRERAATNRPRGADR